MQERLGRDPFEALGLNSSDPGEVRTAFLQLTKIYHPARFARMAVEIQRLANEVFLALRATHDALTRTQVKAPAAGSTGMIPIVRSPAAATRPPTGSIPVHRPTPTPTPATSPVRPGGPIPRSPTPPPAGHATGPVPRAPTPPPAGPGSGPFPRPTTPTPPARITPAMGHPITPARTATGPQPTTPRPGTQPMRPAGLSELPARPGQPPTQPMRPPLAHDPSRPNRLPSSSPPPSTISSGSARSAAPPPRAMPGSGGDPELAAIEELLSQDRLTDARMKLETLVARQPGVPRHQALIHYAKGREAQLARRIDEARVELMDALQVDPDLQLAKTALGELFTRRK